MLCTSLSWNFHIISLINEKGRAFWPDKKGHAQSSLLLAYDKVPFTSD
jgi:hypothetical protein